MYQLPQCWKEESFSSLDQALIMCEMVNPYISRASRVACSSAIKEIFEKSLGDSQNIGYKEQGEGFNPVKTF